ncbi:MAG: response regulator, partial [Chloroflexi bacterium]|nr:response regulator [Chloroflexota bacterium]
TISVRDSGIGIETEVIGQIFEPFSQADRSLDRSRGGLGLGLALVKGLVTLHGGSVEAHSGGPGQGTEFLVHLPQQLSHFTRKRDSETTRRPTVLIIEDTPDAAETLGDILEAFGYQVEIAMDGCEGLQKALEHHPDVVLCDIGLPGMDGYSVAAELRDNATMSDTSLVAITGYGTEDDRRRSEAAGFQAHLIKPVNLDELKKILARMASAPTP